MHADAPIKLKKGMGFGLVAVAFIFLFNPDVSVIDVIPDIFGYVLLSVGLSQLSMLNDHIDEALSRFKKMILVSAAKIASLFFIFGMSDSANRPYSLLLFSFTFGVVELLFLIPAYGELFKGILTIADRYDGKVAYQSRRAGGKTYAEKIHVITVAFVVLKSVCTVLPECISLLNTEYTDSFVMYLYKYIGVFRVFAIIPVLVLGIIWLIKARGFFVKLSRENEFIENIKRAFAEELFPKKGLFVRKNLQSVILLLTVGAVFCVDFALGSVGVIGDSDAEINILPDAIAAILIFVSAVMMKKYVDNTKNLKISALVFLGVSIVGSALKLSFIAKYDYYTAVNKIDSAFVMYIVMCAVTVIENIAFFVTVIFLVKMLKEIIKKYTGYSAYSDPKDSERVTSLQNDLIGKLKYMIIFAALSVVSAILYEVFLPEKHLIAQYMWAIDLFVQAVFAAFTLRCLYAVKDEMENKFMLE